MRPSCPQPIADRTDYEVHPEPPPRNRSAQTTDGVSPRHSAEDATAEHAQAFITYLRNRTRPASDVAVGHRSTILCHLGNIAPKTGRKLKWAAHKEEIVGNAGASRMLACEARKPWDLI